MTALATDNFDRADNLDLGSVWDVQTGEARFEILTNRAYIPAGGALGNDATENYNGVSWPNDQYSQVLLITGTGTADQAGIGCATRCSASARTYYRAVANHAASNNVSFQKMVAASYTNIGQRTQAWTDGAATLRLESVGTNHTLKINGSALGAAFSDSAIASGRAGVSYSSTMTSVFIDDWEGGDFVSATPDPQNPGLSVSLPDAPMVGGGGLAQ